jgi:adenosylmethionine-8-amino-7-oxononanoate aminotransferase
MDVMRGLGSTGSHALGGCGEPYAPLHAVRRGLVEAAGHSLGRGVLRNDDKGRSYIDGLAGLFTTQVGHGRAELAEVAAKQMKELGFFPNWSFQHPRAWSWRTRSPR